MTMAGVDDVDDNYFTEGSGIKDYDDDGGADDDSYAGMERGPGRRRLPSMEIVLE